MNVPALATTPNPARPDLLVVCGPPRSGTTWLQRELCTLPGSYPFLPECTYITQQIALFHAAVHYGEQKRTKAYFRDRTAIQDYFRGNVERLLILVKHLNPQDNAKLLILKDPELCHCLDVLRDVLPPHKIVIIVRDPRDVLASMKQVAARRNERWNIRAASEYVANYYYQISNFFGNTQPNAILVRYEDLVSGPSRMVDLIRFAGCEPDLQLAKTSEAGVGEMMDPSDPFFSDLYLRPTTAERIGNYRNILNRIEVSHFEEDYMGVIRQWDYQPASYRARGLYFFAKAMKNTLRSLSSR